MKTIDVIVFPDGSSKVETNGFVGGDCQRASQFVEQALGRRLDETKKAEFFQQSVSHEQQARQR